MSKQDQSPDSDDPSKAGDDSAAGDIGTPLGDNAGVYIPTNEESAEPSASSEAPIDFGGFIVSLGTSCLVNLGHVENPETGQTEIDLEAAEQTIEILKMLKHKTRGNLEAEEEKLLESLLHDTRLAYREAVDNRQENT